MAIFAPFLLLSLFKLVLMQVYSPFWGTTSHIQADSKKIIDGDLCNCVTGNNAIRNVNVTFLVPFITTPRIAYGISSYIGRDALINQIFQINKTAIAQTYFSVLAKISGTTFVWTIQIRYIAVSPFFPYHLNVFDNVHANYPNNILTNITTFSTSPHYYMNTINYTLQAQTLSLSYSRFSFPLTNNKILLFLTTFDTDGAVDVTGTPAPLELSVDATVDSIDTYTIFVNHSVKARINSIHFCMIIFDKVNIQASGQYLVTISKVEHDSLGGMYYFQQNLLTNFMIGFQQFSSPKTASVISFQTRFLISNNSFGAFMPPSVVTNTSLVKLSRFAFNVFYIKTWSCPNRTYMNYTINMCQDCPLYCLSCYSTPYLVKCIACDNSFGYVLDPYSLQCRPCNLTQCLLCNRFNTCSICNETNNYFLNPFYLYCQNCTLLNCVRCKTLFSCSVCNQTNNSFLNPINELCQSCNVVNCLRCSSRNTCALCNQVMNYFLSYPSLQCQLCSLPNCISCSTLTTCALCNEASRYFLNTATQLCQLCNLTACLTCSSLTSCASCNQSIQYFLNPLTLECGLCTIPFCLQCSSLITCAVCDKQNNYFLNVSTIRCTACTIPNCIQCSSLRTCSICNQTNGYFINRTTLLCDLCTIPNCLYCSSLNTCLTCDEANGYFLNASTLFCNICVLPNCAQCSTLSTCSVCNSTYDLNPLSLHCQICQASFCLQCSTTTTTCAVCDQANNYVLNPSTQQCQLCSLSFCLQCNSPTTCSLCDQANNRFLNQNTLLCESCSLPFCIECVNLNECLTCDNSSLTLLNNITKQCEPAFSSCGNNFYEPSSQQCDDGNTVNGDGCSSSCSIETNFVCEANTAPGTRNTLCFSSQQLSLKVVRIQKTDHLNRVEVLLELTPADLPMWNGVDFASMVTISNFSSFNNFSVIRNPDLTVSVFLSYNKSIHNNQFTVQFDPKKSGRLSLSRFSAASRTFAMTPSDNDALLVYDENTYKTAKVIQILSYSIVGLSLLLFFISLVAGKLVGVEMIAVLQISHLSLMTLQSNNPCFKALSKLELVNGFNYFSLSDQAYDPNIPASVKALRLHSLFFQNYNFTLLFLVCSYVIGLACFLCSRSNSQKIKGQRLAHLASRCAFEFALSCYMFSGYIVGVALGLEILYGLKSEMNSIAVVSILQCCVVLVLYIAYFCLLLKVKRRFGQFTQSFKKTPSKETQQSKIDCVKQAVSKKWYNILLVERILIGSCLVFMIDMSFSLLLPICIFAFLLGGIIILRPYSETKHNIRFVCNMAITIIILIIYLSYQMAPVQQRNISLWQFFPIIVCVLLLICIVYNALILVSDVLTSKLEAFKNQYELELTDLTKTRTANPQLISEQNSNILITDLEANIEKAQQSRNKLQMTKRIRQELKSQLGLFNVNQKSKNMLNFNNQQNGSQPNVV